MLTAEKTMNKRRFKRKTVVLSALEVLVFVPYGNSANRVETAPVPVKLEVASDMAICRGHDAQVH
jgi:hypothetical protein